MELFYDFDNLYYNPELENIAQGFSLNDAIIIIVYNRQGELVKTVEAQLPMGEDFTVL